MEARLIKSVFVCVCSLISAACEVEARGPKDNCSSTNVMKISGLMKETDRPLKCLDDGKTAHASDIV